MPKMLCWGAIKGSLQFVVSHDQHNDLIKASVKITPNLGKRYDIGTFNSVEEAKTACERYQL